MVPRAASFQRLRMTSAQPQRLRMTSARPCVPSDFNVLVGLGKAWHSSVFNLCWRQHSVLNCLSERSHVALDNLKSSKDTFSFCLGGKQAERKRGPHRVKKWDTGNTKGSCNEVILWFPLSGMRNQSWCRSNTRSGERAQRTKASEKLLGNPQSKVPSFCLHLR